MITAQQGRWWRRDTAASPLAGNPDNPVHPGKQKEIAKTMLSNMPDSVFESFISPIVDDIGWPFLNAESLLLGTDWYRVLFPLTLRNLCGAIWSRKQFFINKDSLYEGSQQDVELTIRNKTEDVWAIIGRDSSPCRMSLFHHEGLVKSTGSLGAPVTLFVLGNGSLARMVQAQGD